MTKCYYHITYDTFCLRLDPVLPGSNKRNQIISSAFSIRGTVWHSVFFQNIQDRIIWKFLKSGSVVVRWLTIRGKNVYFRKARNQFFEEECR